MVPDFKILFTNSKIITNFLFLFMVFLFSKNVRVFKFCLIYNIHYSHFRKNTISNKLPEHFGKIGYAASLSSSVFVLPCSHSQSIARLGSKSATLGVGYQVDPSSD